MIEDRMFSLEMEKQSSDLRSELEQMKLQFSENKWEQFGTTLMDIAEIEDNMDIIRADMTSQESVIDLQQTQLDALFTNISSLDEDNSVLMSDFEQIGLKYSKKSVIRKGEITGTELSSCPGPKYAANYALMFKVEELITGKPNTKKNIRDAKKMLYYQLHPELKPNPKSKRGEWEILYDDSEVFETGAEYHKNWAKTKLEKAPWFKAKLKNSAKIMSISFEGNSEQDGDSYTFSVINSGVEELCGYYKAKKVGQFRITMGCGSIGREFKITARNSREEGTNLVLHEVECQIIEI